MPVPFQIAYDRYAADIWRFCASQVGADRADDCFQETMLAALSAYPSLRDSEAVRPWLFQIAARKAIDMHRASRRDGSVPDVGGPGSEAAHEVADHGLFNAVRRLPNKQRTAVAYRVVADLSYREIGVLMQTSEEAARRNVHDGLKRLREPARRTRTERSEMTTTEHAHGLSERLRALDWRDLTEKLDEQGFVQTPPIYDITECDQLGELFEEGRFRATIDMRRHRFGDGRYRYFERPLPAPIEEVRQHFYPPLAALANDWAERLGEPQRYPTTLDAFLARCHEAGQERPTPLILRYGAGGHNTMHQDIYGDVAFPLQAVTLLSRPDQFTGGEFVLVEQRPRAQSRAHVITLDRGGFLIFPTRQRPVLGARGHYRTQMRHGVATVHSGERTTLGVIFHDAR